MARVALDLDGAAVDTGDFQPQSCIAQGHRRGVSICFAGRIALGAFGKRKDLLFLPAATVGGGQRQRGAHHLQPSTAVYSARIGFARELRFQKRAKTRRVGQLVQAVPPNRLFALFLFL